jgi:hypothetical protein
LNPGQRPISPCGARLGAPVRGTRKENSQLALVRSSQPVRMASRNPLAQIGCVRKSRSDEGSLVIAAPQVRLSIINKINPTDRHFPRGRNGVVTGFVCINLEVPEARNRRAGSDRATGKLHNNGHGGGETHDLECPEYVQVRCRVTSRGSCR